MMDEGHSGGGSPWTSGHCSLAFVCDGSTDKTNVQNPIITPISHSEWKTVLSKKKPTQKTNLSKGSIPILAVVHACTDKSSGDFSN